MVTQKSTKHVKMTFEYFSELTSIGKYDAVEKLKREQRVTDEIRHIKCPIIKLVKRQIESAERRTGDCSDLCQRNKSWKHKLWKHRWTIMKWLLMAMVMVSLFIYGALLGAGLCSCSVSQHSLPCAGTFSLLPGLNFAKRHTFIY